MLVNVSPILIAVLGGLLLHKGFREGFWSVTPSCLLEPALATSSHGPTVGVGALLCLVAAAAYAAALILDKPCSPARRRSPSRVWRVPLALSAACLLPGSSSSRLAACNRPARLGRLPWRGADGDQLQHLGLRARPQPCRSVRCDDLSHFGTGGGHELAAPDEVPGWAALGGGAVVSRRRRGGAGSQFAMPRSPSRTSDRRPMMNPYC